MSCSSGNEQNTTVPPNVYLVKKITKAIQITGNGEDPAWQRANLLSNFTYPWREETPPATTFKALYTDSHLYFLYRATDPDIITKEKGLGEKDVVNSDRVEIFFKADDQMDPYYSLEMDALGRVLDTEGRHYRKVDFDWTWPEGHLEVKTSIDSDGYWLEGSVTFASLRQLGMYKDDHILKAGLYRGEYVTEANGEIETKWISWIIPDSATPDFHIPSSFGILELLEDHD